MFIKPSWRILTIGDGDLSFSASIAQHIKPRSLVATIYDNKTSLTEKYSNKFFDKLTKYGIPVLTSIDVTDSSTWGGISLHSFDLVIFQFPLVPNNSTFQEHQHNKTVGSNNTINRLLLHRFLAHCFEFFLDKNGQRLAMITSKDVKPYRQWNIETSLVDNLKCDYIGQCDFNFDDYPNYQIRNVDRNKFVKETQAISYFYSDKSQPHMAQHLKVPNYCYDDDFCTICRVGPITTEKDWDAHIDSKRHRQMSIYEAQWQSKLDSINKL